MGASLIEVTKAGDLERIQELLDKKWYRSGVNPDQKDKWGCAAIHYASETENENLLSLLISKGADVNAVNRFDHQPIHNAARLGKMSAVRLLIEAGADMEATEDHGFTALHWAMREEREDVASWLIENGANQEAKSKDGKKPSEL